MRNLFIILFLSYLSSVFNDDIYYDVDKNNFYKSYYDLGGGNRYFFVCKAKLSEIISFGVKLVNQKNVFEIISMNAFTIYSKNHKSWSFVNLSPTCKEINYDCVNMMTGKSESNAIEYMGIGLSFYQRVSQLQLSIATDNIINLKNNEINTRKLLPLIQYYYNIDVGNNNRFNISLCIEASYYINNEPFIFFNITENLNKNSGNSVTTTVNAHFNRNLNNYNKFEFSYSYKIINPENNINNISFIFWPNELIENFNIKVIGVLDIPDDDNKTSGPFGLSILAFSLIISGGVVFIAAIIIMIIFVIKKRKNYSNQLNETSEIPLVKQ